MLSGSMMSPVLETKLIRSDCQARNAEPCLSLRPPATPSPGVLADERFSRFDLKYSTVSSRGSGHGHREALEEPAKMDKATTSVFSSRNSEETGMQQVASDLQALKTLYGLLHKSSADENLDKTSRTLLTKMIDDSTQQALMKQAKMLSGSMMSPVLERNLSIRSVCQARDAEPGRSLRPPASPSHSILAGERSSRLNLQYSTVSSQPDGQFHGQAPEEPAKIDKATTSVFPSRNNEETGMQQVASELQALKTLYGLLHKGPADENLDETSRAVMMNMLDDATHQVLLKQAKMLSGCSLMSPVLERKLSIQSNRQTRDAAEPRRNLRPLASPSPSLLAGKRSPGPSILAGKPSSRYSTVSSRASHRLAPEEPPLLSRLGSYRSSASALPPSPRPSREQRRSGLSIHRMSVAATSQHGTVTGSSRHGDRRDRTRHSSSRGDQSQSPEGCSRHRSMSRRGDQTLSLEGSNSNRRSVSRRGDQTPSLEESSRSREMSLGRAQLHGHGTPRHVEAVSSLSSTRRFGRLDSGLSLRKTRPSRAVATPEWSSSSSKTVVTIRSRIKPDRDTTEHNPRRAEEAAEVSTHWRGRKGASVSSRGRSGSRPRRELKRIDSVDMYISSSRNSSGAAMSYPSTSPSVLPESRSASAASYSPPPPVSRRGIALPVYAPRMSRSMRQRRRCEVLERRVGRLRMLKSKIAAVFHHRHDHHHHHHFGPHDQEEGPSYRGIGGGIPGEHDRRASPWRYLGEMFQHVKRQDKKVTTSRAVVGTPATAKRRSGGNMHALFDAMRQHLRGKKRATASVKMRKMAKKSRTQANKMHWWQQLGRRRGKTQVTAGKPRRRLI